MKMSSSANMVSDRKYMFASVVTVGSNAFEQDCPRSTKTSPGVSTYMESVTKSTIGRVIPSRACSAVTPTGVAPSVSGFVTSFHARRAETVPNLTRARGKLHPHRESAAVLSVLR